MHEPFYQIVQIIPTLHTMIARGPALLALHLEHDPLVELVRRAGGYG